MKNALLIMVASLAVACCNCKMGSPKIGELESATWRLIEMNQNPIENSLITLRFLPAEKQIVGTAACNNFFGGYSLLDKKGGIHISNIGATRKMCPDMEQEMTFTRLLPSVVKVQIEADNLFLLNAQGDLVAMLKAERTK